MIENATVIMISTQDSGLFTVGKDGNLLFEGKEYRVDSVPVQVRERPLIPQDQTGGR